MHEIQTEIQKPKAILIGLDTGEYHAEFSMKELEELAATAGCEVVLTCIQARPAPEAATCIGTGKLEEIAQAVQDLQADLLIFDTELTGMQMRNISMPDTSPGNNPTMW